MNKEQIAHDMAVAFADRVLRERYDNGFGNQPDYIGAANVLASEYSNIYPEILSILAAKELPR